MNKALSDAKRKAWAAGAYAHLTVYRGGSRRDMRKFWAQRVIHALQLQGVQGITTATRITHAIAVEQLNAAKSSER